jgi:phosphohistidine phosphatase SixA
MRKQIIFGFMASAIFFAATNVAFAHKQKMYAQPGQTYARVLIMRHAEKPRDKHNPNLAPAGYQRAQELVPYIMDHFGRPDYIMVAANSKSSERPFETAMPLSQATGVPIDSQYADKDYKQLAHTLTSDYRFQGKFIVIVWHHHNIANLAHCLKAKDGTYPKIWKENVYNQLIELDYNGQKHPIVDRFTEPF